MKKILITGGSGFIGFSLAKELLNKGTQIVLCDNLSRGKLDTEIQKFLDQNDNVEFIQCDLTDKEELMVKIKGNFDYVFHLAAVVGVKYTNEEPLRVLKTNIVSTLNILEWMVKTKSRKIIFSSTSEVYSGGFLVSPNFPIPTPEGIPLIISDVKSKRFTYAVSKLVGEMMIINYARKYKFNYTIVRYHNIYGPRMGCEHVIPELILRICRKENPFKLYSPEQTRAFCYIDDAVDATTRLIKTKKSNSEIFHVGNDKEEITIKELCERLFNIAGFHPVVKALKPPEGSVQRRCPDISKLKKITGYEPKIDINTGLRRTFKWYKEKFQNKA